MTGKPRDETIPRLRALACHGVIYVSRPMRAFGELVESGHATVDQDELRLRGRIFYRITKRGAVLDEALRRQERRL